MRRRAPGPLLAALALLAPPQALAAPTVRRRPPAGPGASPAAAKGLEGEAPGGGGLRGAGRHGGEGAAASAEVGGREGGSRRSSGGGHGHGEEALDSTSCAVMFVFFGCLVMAGSVNSVLRWNDPDIRMASYRMLSVSVSIFCAMTTFKMIESFTFEQLIAGAPPRGLGIKDVSHDVHLVINMIMFPCFMAAITWCCRCTYRKELDTWFRVARLLVPHIAGFSGFVLSDNILSAVVEHVHRQEVPSAIFVATLLGLLLSIRLLCWAMQRWRHRSWYQDCLEREDPGEDQDPGILRTSSSARWNHRNALEQCTEAIEEGEDDVTAFVMSGALYGFIRYHILSMRSVGCREDAATFEMVPHKLPESCVHIEVAKAWVLCTVPVVAAMIVTTCKCWNRLPLVDRAAQCLSMTFGMLACRLILGLTVHAFYWYTESKVAVYMGTAIFTTTLAILLTFSLDFLADRLEDTGPEDVLAPPQASPSSGQLPERQAAPEVELAEMGSCPSRKSAAGGAAAGPLEPGGDEQAEGAAGQAAAPQPPPAQGEMAAPARPGLRRFDSLDVNHDGVITAQELMVLDANHDGVISPQEFLSGGAAEDASNVGHHVAYSTRSLMKIFGLLVGLSWEAVFETGEADMVAFVNLKMQEQHFWQEEHEVLFEVCITSMVLFFVVPVWAKHLIPAAEKNREYHQQRIREEQMEATSDMFTCSVLNKLWWSCCPQLRRCRRRINRSLNRRISAVSGRSLRSGTGASSSRGGARSTGRSGRSGLP